MPSFLGDAWRFLQTLAAPARHTLGPAHTAMTAPRIQRDPTLAPETDYAANVVPLIGAGQMAEALYTCDGSTPPILVGWWIVPTDFYADLEKELE